MSLEGLQDVMRIEARVFIVESRYETEGDDVVFAAVDPCAAVLVTGERPAQRVDHFAGGDASWRQLPQFLYTNAVGLRIAVFVELEASDELLGERSTSTLGEDRDFSSQVVAGLEIRFGLILLVEALVVGANANHAIVFDQKLRTGESGKD